MIHDNFLSIDPRILGQRLQGARKSANLTQQEVAEAMKLARTTIVAIEKGERLPKEEELLQLSELYQRPLHELLRQYTPSEPLIVQFRALRRIEEKLETDIEQKLNEFQKLCDDYLYLEQLLSNPLPQAQIPLYSFESFEGVTPERLGEEAAWAERNRLGLGDAPILNLREILETEGIRIFQLELPARISGFFGSTELLGPCIALNRNHPPERRQWSLAHEYAHVLTRRRQASITIHHGYQHVPENERFADAFARAFLMPASSVSREFLEKKKMRGCFLPADLCLLAHFFFVSFEAMARRLEDLRLTRAGSYDRIISRGFKPQEAFSLLNLPAHVINDDIFPLRYTLFAIEAFANGKIPEEEFADLLRTDLLNARRIFTSFRTQYIVSASGEDSVIEVPFDDDLRM
jgi:Zn-dependent peptidase ImmA (M78 family)/transcriptional regulator with XRE-family HTH domain